MTNVQEQLTALVEEYRDRCLWFLRPDYMPSTPEETRQVLDLIERYGDLATNKVLAMAGRLEVRDWVDAISCDESLQPLGYLLWAACGKDPGYNPHSLLASARRLHYSQSEVDTLDFAMERPSAARLGARWHEVLGEAERVIAVLPPAHVGTCVLLSDRQLFRGDATVLAGSLKTEEVLFHEGRIGGAWPCMRG